jgi:RimJ/RimL family protein N-acetyltransferase
MSTSPTRPVVPPVVLRVALKDGTPVTIRPIRPDDKPLLVDGLARLSEESRYRRFLSPIGGFTEDQLRYLTEVDYHDHFAWVALHGEWPDVGLGVARYVRVPDRPDVADVAVTVVDEYQGRGLGTILLAVLARTALAEGIRRFRGDVLAVNTPMRRLLRRFGAEAHLESPGLVEAELDLDRLTEIAGSLGITLPEGESAPEG